MSIYDMKKIAEDFWKLVDDTLSDGQPEGEKRALQAVRKLAKNLKEAHSGDADVCNLCTDCERAETGAKVQEITDLFRAKR